MSAHTPGPWSVQPCEDDPYGDIRIVAQPNRGIARLWLDDAPEHNYNREQEANARLIAEAPELLALLREARSSWIVDHRWEGDQYGGCMVAAGSAMQEFGVRLDALLAKVKA